MTVAARMMDLGTETAFEVLAKARTLEAQGKEIIHLEIGEPDFDTPKHIVDAGVEAIRQQRREHEEWWQQERRAHRPGWH